jgi:hypothetical protein
MLFILTELRCYYKMVPTGSNALDYKLVNSQLYGLLGVMATSWQLPLICLKASLTPELVNSTSTVGVVVL